MLNDTRVIPARLVGQKPSGGRVEIFLVRGADSDDRRNNSPSDETWEEMWEVLLRGAGRTPIGTLLALDGGVTAEVVSRAERGAAVLRFRGGRAIAGLLAHADKDGSIPLPPYIEAARRRAALAGRVEPIDDRVRYQTVFARVPGAVAAPTAGLHFTEGLLTELVAAGHEIVKLTLHVGPGTFRPVEVDDPALHRMDLEHYEVSEATAAALRRARAEGRPIVAVGTTVVRTLETLARAAERAGGDPGEIAAGKGATDIFILPGARFRLVTDLVTNFHLPRSTLLMLVAAFVGREEILAAYAEAVRERYRFYSYGDAMLLTGHGLGPPPP